jgi:thioredoxin-like negative regulator of GroEL
MGKFNREKRAKSKKGGSKKKNVTVEELVEQAQEAISLVQLETAVELYEQALQLQPQNTDLMDALADVCLQIGDTNKALELLRVSTSAAPTSNGIKWMYLGQLLSGLESVNAYNTGINIFSSQINTLTDQVRRYPPF